MCETTILRCWSVWPNRHMLERPGLLLETRTVAWSSLGVYPDRLSYQVVRGGCIFNPSVITLKPAIRYHFKTGQRDRPKT
jgi:hypothetical protein